MSDKLKKRIHLIYGIVLSALLVLTGILLMASCVSVYKLGSRPFTPENISAAFAKIAIPVWGTVGAVIVGGILRMLLHVEDSSPKAIRNQKIILSRLQEKLNIPSCRQETVNSIKKEQRFRAVLRTVAVILCVISALPAVLYVFNVHNYNDDLNASVIAACAWILPCSFIILGICMALAYLENASYNRQIVSVKKALAESPSKTNGTGTDKKHRPHFKIITGIRVAVAVIAFVFIIVGIFNGGMADVLTKAVNICTECIGLG